eukprot:1850198-Amphidinium_carterae.1
MVFRNILDGISGTGWRQHAMPWHCLKRETLKVPERTMGRSFVQQQAHQLHCFYLEWCWFVYSCVQYDYVLGQQRGASAKPGPQWCFVGIAALCSCFILDENVEGEFPIDHRMRPSFEALWSLGMQHALLLKALAENLETPHGAMQLAWQGHGECLQGGCGCYGRVWHSGWPRSV